MSFNAPSFIMWQTDWAPSWFIDYNLLNANSDGVYDINIIGRHRKYWENTPYVQIGPGNLKLDLHMYRPSKCKFDASGNPSRVVYYIKRDPELVTFTFKPFKMLTEGCVYDRFTYEFYSIDTGSGALSDAPGFIFRDPSTLSFNISTDNLGFIGRYNLVLWGSLNPYLTLQHPFVLQMEEYIYPNKEPPMFTQRLISPLKVSLQSDKSYKLPVIKDKDNDLFSVDVFYLNKG